MPRGEDRFRKLNLGCEISRTISPGLQCLRTAFDSFPIDVTIRFAKVLSKAFYIQDYLSVFTSMRVYKATSLDFDIMVG
jgi:hypothetical protein